LNNTGHASACQRTTDFRRGQRLGQRDHLIVLQKPAIKPDWMPQADYEQAPESVTVRELRSGCKTLVTTLLARAYVREHGRPKKLKQMPFTSNVRVHFLRAKSKAPARRGNTPD
jgi:hypothetical protein